MMKKVFYTILFSILFSLTLFGCKLDNDAFPMCKISVTSNDDEHCSVTLDKTTATLGSFVTLHVQVDDAYRLSSIKWEKDNSYYGEDAFLTQDENDPNTYYVMVSSTDMKIEVHVSAKETNQINRSAKFCKIELPDATIDRWDDPIAYLGKKVCFTVTPDKYYCIDSEKIAVNDYKGKIDFTQDETDPTKFYFIMTNNTVTIGVECVPGIALVPEKTTNMKGDEITLNITNKTSESKVDLYSSWSGQYNVELYQSDFDITKKTYVYTANQAGVLSFYVKDNKNQTIEIGKFEIRFPELPADKKPLSIVYKGKTEIDHSSWANSQLQWRLNLETSYGGCKVNYYYKDKPDDVTSNYASSSKVELEFEYCYDNQRTVVIYFTDEEDNQKYQSESIEITLPIYHGIKNPASPGTKSIYGSDISSDYFDFYYSDEKLTSSNYDLEIESGAEEYFTCSINDSSECIKITAKTKVTAIPRLITLKNKNGDKVAEIYVTIPFSGTPSYKATMVNN